MSKRLFAFIALFVFVQVSFAAWSGSAKLPKVVKSDGQDYYEITTPEELVWFLDSATVLREYDETLRAYLKNDIVLARTRRSFVLKNGFEIRTSPFFRGSLMAAGIPFMV